MTRASAAPSAFEVVDLRRMGYAPAYDAQIAHLERVLASREAEGDSRRSAGFLLLVEHDPPVITISRRPAAAEHLLASTELLARAGIEIQPTDRGGDITYHGPGQLVAYPILDLNLLGLRLHEYMRALEDAVIALCESFGVSAVRDQHATGVWAADDTGAAERKICAMGVRVKRWVSMHGLALNVTTNLAHFDHIVPCGLAGRPVTSLRRELGDRSPTMDETKDALIRELDAVLSPRLTRSSSAPGPDRR
ncbi:MAG: lipoyl(octanoyl) transferase LipB [Phycisphaeraceae bacterium]|nr:lipoyl(octanoyl) transferase LipB [Phycisphaeraceae bacterium]